ncbi:hypothetical protein BKA62DRAFT_766859 [Auriculariales sp. MPI-PUGE-AT-0066]|nr:hypothetical protein BKA62DRAFT_766859 [Auriculariales sp. MPI-PUGE-AT-0066]
MFSVSRFVAAALLAAPALVSADLGKGTAFPDGLHDPLVAFDTIKSTGRTNRASSVPQICKDYAAGEIFGQEGNIACDVGNIEAREVFYDDCEQSWTLCRCPDANLSLDQMEERFGQVPVGIRSYVGAVLATNAGGCSAVCFNGNFIRFHGDCPMTVFLHESGHALDQGMSGSDGFKGAISQDTCVPDGYANSNEAEDFTQVNVLYTYTKQFGPIPGDISCMQNQFNALANDERINQAQDTKTCLADKRPFTTPNENAPPADPSTDPAPADPAPADPAPADPAPQDPAPADPPVSAPGPVSPQPEDPTTPPVDPTPPKNCNSAKFRFRNKVKRAAKNAYRVATKFVKGKMQGTVTVPYHG